MEVALPAGMHYRAGDHLGVLPRNSLALIRRVMCHFKLDAGMYLTIAATSGAHTHLPIDEPAPLLGILGSCVELQAAATRADIDVLADHTDDPAQQAELRALTGDDEESRARYRTTVHEPGLSVLDLLERYPACRLPFPVFLDLLPALAPRYYSISSSPLVEPAVMQRHRGRAARARPAAASVISTACARPTCSRWNPAARFSCSPGSPPSRSGRPRTRPCR